MKPWTPGVDGGEGEVTKEGARCTAVFPPRARPTGKQKSSLRYHRHTREPIYSLAKTLHGSFVGIFDSQASRKQYVYVRLGAIGTTGVPVSRPRSHRRKRRDEQCLASSGGIHKETHQYLRGEREKQTGVQPGLTVPVRDSVTLQRVGSHVKSMQTVCIGGGPSVQTCNKPGRSLSRPVLSDLGRT